jgi:hypothetical protein
MRCAVALTKQHIIVQSIQVRVSSLTDIWLEKGKEEERKVALNNVTNGTAIYELKISYYFPSVGIFFVLNPCFHHVVNILIKCLNTPLARILSVYTTRNCKFRK